MRPTIVRNVKIGEGLPKICVPIIGRTETEIIDAAEAIIKSKADLVEWRVDWFESVFEEEKVIEIANKLRHILGELPLLFTFRTKEEGGEKEIDKAAYIALNKKVAESGFVDLVDVEVFALDDMVGHFIELIKQCNVKVIGSNHDFEKTPSKGEIIRRLKHMQTIGVDIAKIAVMPQKEADVEELLEATLEMHEKHAVVPIVTMSMGELGLVSRLEGEKYGSSITFGCLGKASAPGQMNVNELRKVLEMQHRSCLQ